LEKWNGCNLEYISINETKVKMQFLRKRRITEDKSKDQTSKRKKLECDVDSLKKTLEKQQIQILNLKLGNVLEPQITFKP